MGYYWLKAFNQSMIKKILAFIFIFSFLHGAKPVHIAFVFDGKSERFMQLKGNIEKEMRDLMEPEWDLHFVDFVGNWNLESVKREVDLALGEKQIDVVFAMGVIASEVITQIKDLPKPVIAPFIVDRVLQQLPVTPDDTSGVKNLNYLTFPNTVIDDLKLFKEIVPWCHLVMINEKASLEAFPEVFHDLQRQVKELGIDMTIVPATDSAAGALAQIPPGTDAVYVTILPRFSGEEISCLAQGLIERKLPSFALFSKEFVGRGILGSAAAIGDFDRLARRLALNVQSIMMGDNPSEFSTIISHDTQLSINAKTAQDLGISLPWKVLLNANMIDQDKLTRPPKLSLVEAVQFGLEMNPNLQSVWQEVLAGIEDVNLAKARLRLQVEVSVLARIIDRDRALFSLGREPQSAIFGITRLSQMLYSNQLIGDVAVQRYLQYARCDNYKISKLDLIFEVSTAYLDVLRSKTLEDIQKNNAKLTQLNLQTAEKRVEVGVARLSEVYRWESQLSDNRSSVVDAYFQTESSEVVLSRLLNQNQAQSFNLEEITLEEPYWLLKREWLENQLQNPYDLSIFAKFSVAQGFVYSPELKQLQEQIWAQGEVLGIASRAFWQPDFFLIGETRELLAKGGAGIRTPPKVNNTDWLFGIEMNFQLYTGGQKTATVRKAYQELLRLRYLYIDLLNQIEANIRVNINKASASYASIGLAKAAAAAAQQNLALILDGYAKGAETIIDLLDAQNQSLNNDLLVVNAIYDFLNDALAVQRAVGRFDFLMTSDDRLLWERDLEKFKRDQKKHACK